jgi:hypothetical protein
MNGLANNTNGPANNTTTGNRIPYTGVTPRPTGYAVLQLLIVLVPGLLHFIVEAFAFDLADGRAA